MTETKPYFFWDAVFANGRRNGNRRYEIIHPTFGEAHIGAWTALVADGESRSDWELIELKRSERID